MTQTAAKTTGRGSRNGHGSDTSQRVLDTAERLMQVRGYNGFSYADIASALKLTKASLHYHFASKTELGRSLMERYTRNFLTALAEIDGSGAKSPEKLRRYVSIYSAVLAKNRMCLCGMLAAEYATLPKSVRTEVTRFVDANEAWLASVLENGARAKHLKLEGSPRDAARAMIATLEGAMMLARSYGDTGRFERTGERLLAELTR
jgi:TetR/AcrR family transcriptional regulator, transcriptional repressor for nem operon